MNQWILIGTIIVELLLIVNYGKQIGEHFWILTVDTFIILTEV
jgi:general stress protein CsbA